MNLNSATYARFSRKMEQSLLVMHLHWTMVLVQWFWWVLKKQLHLVALHLHVFAVLLTLQHFQSISQSHPHLLFQRLLNGLVSPRTMWVQKKFSKIFRNFFFEKIDLKIIFRLTNGKSTKPFPLLPLQINVFWMLIQKKWIQMVALFLLVIQSECLVLVSSLIWLIILNQVNLDVPPFVMVVVVHLLLFSRSSKS